MLPSSLASVKHDAHRAEVSGEKVEFQLRQKHKQTRRPLTAGPRQQRTAVARRPDAACAAIEQAHTERVVEIGDL